MIKCTRIASKWRISWPIIHLICIYKVNQDSKKRLTTLNLLLPCNRGNALGVSMVWQISGVLSLKTIASGISSCFSLRFLENRCDQSTPDGTDLLFSSRNGYRYWAWQLDDTVQIAQWLLWKIIIKCVKPQSTNVTVLYWWGLLSSRLSMVGVAFFTECRTL